MTETNLDRDVSQAFDLYSGTYPNMNIIKLTLWGSRLYGYAGDESDLDIRGIFIAPIRDMIGIKSVKDTYQNTSWGDGNIDVAVHELGKVAYQAFSGNGNFLELLVTGDHTRINDSVSDEITDLFPHIISKAHGRHYMGYGKKLMHDWIENPTAKNYLQASRVIMTGMCLLDFRSIIVRYPDLIELCVPANYSESIPVRIMEMRKQKKDAMSTELYEFDELKHFLERMYTDLSDLCEYSDLPQEGDKEKVNDWVVEMRLRELE